MLDGPAQGAGAKAKSGAQIDDVALGTGRNLEQERHAGLTEGAVMDIDEELVENLFQMLVLQRRIDQNLIKAIEELEREVLAGGRERQLLQEDQAIPLGRLCEVIDLATQEGFQRGRSPCLES